MSEPRARRAPRPIAAPILARGRAAIATVVVRVIAALTVVTFVLALWNPHNDDLITVAFYVPILAAMLAFDRLAQRGQTRWVGWGLTASLLGIATAAVLLAGGLEGNTGVAYFMPVMVSMALLGRRPTLAVASLSGVAMSALAVLQSLGSLPTPSYAIGSTLNQWLSLIVPLTLASYLVVALFALLEHALEEAERHGRARDRAQAELVHAQKLDTVGRLVATVAHDFNNLLTVVMSATDVLERAQLGEAEGKATHDIGVAAQRAALLTRRLLAFSRPAEGQPRPVDLTPYVEELAPVLERLVGEGVTVRWQLDDEAWVRLDPLAFDQVLLNLLINAKEALQGRGVIEVHLRRHRATLELRVDDAGPGVPHDQRDAIFQPFFTTKGTGTGLGLSTVRHLVARSEGEVEVTTSDLGGASFRIRWPRLDDPPDPTSGTHPLPQPPARRRALVVDDYEPVRDATALMLRSSGWEVLVAADGLEALAILEGQPVEVLISDVQMPGMDGLQLTERVARSHPDLPILLVTGHPLDPMPEGVRVLLKPFRHRQLLTAITDVLPTEAPPP